MNGDSASQLTGRVILVSSCFSCSGSGYPCQHSCDVSRVIEELEVHCNSPAVAGN